MEYRRLVGKPRSVKGRASVVAERLADLYPGSTRDLCELDYENPFQLLAATMLSAQTTDVRVNLVTPVLFAKYPTPADLAAANIEELEEIVRSTGFYRNKAKSLQGMAVALESRFGGEVPTSIEDLVTIPGTGRKTANVVRSVAMNEPGLPVDTHVLRLSKRLGLVDADLGDDAVKVEHALGELIKPADRGVFSLRLILHGRRVCDAKKPKCAECSLRDICPSAS